MPEFTPPLRDIKFNLRHIANLHELIGYPGFEHVDPDTIDGALDEAGRFMSEVVAPTNRAGDEIGCTWNDGYVTTPEAFRAAWRKYVDAGWGAVAGPPAFGGHGFPETVGLSRWFGTTEAAPAGMGTQTFDPANARRCVPGRESERLEQKKAVHFERPLSFGRGERI